MYCAHLIIFLLKFRLVTQLDGVKGISRRIVCVQITYTTLNTKETHCFLALTQERHTMYHSSSFPYL